MSNDPRIPTRDERESADEWARIDARTRLRNQETNRASLRRCLAGVLREKRRTSCPISLGQLDAEVKFFKGDLATCEAEITSCNKLLEGR